MDRVRWLAAGAAALAAVPLAPASGLLAFALCAPLLALSLPLMRRYAMARVNHRSGHREPTPQGAGAPVLIAAIAATGIWLAIGVLPPGLWLLTLAGATLALAVVGGWDDLRPLPARPRLLAQVAAVGAVLATAPPEWRIIASGSGADLSVLVAERLVLVVAGVWFVNLTNFMDGLDGITVANLVPPLATVTLLGLLGHASAASVTLAAATAGALLAFAPFNWHPARCFLGDVGSLSLGLVTGAALFDIATHGALAAAVILPLYPVADATATLLSRWRRGVDVTQPHREHAYQRAADAGLAPMRIAAEVLLLNLALALLAITATLWSGHVARLGCVALGLALAAGLILRFRSIGRDAT